MAVNWDTVLDEKMQMSSKNQSPYARTVVNRTVPISQSLTQPLFTTAAAGELSDISPSSESLNADADGFLLGDDQFLDDWSFFDSINQGDRVDFSTNGTNAQRNAAANATATSTTMNPADLTKTVTIPATVEGLSVAVADVPIPSLEGGATDLKRLRAPNDSRAACWTSPLCPNHNKEGTPPNPATCGGGCAPFLFDYQQSLEDAALDQPNLNIETSPEEDDDATDIAALMAERERPHPKRTESGSTVSTQPPTRRARGQPKLKRESPNDSADEEEPSPPAPQTKGRPRGRVPHNQVERKYRESLNTQLESLRRVVPELSRPSAICEGADIEDLPAPSKPSKAVILASATSYIKQMEKEKKQMAEENRQLRIRLKALQALVKCDDCGLMQYVMDLKINGNK